jgi:hypothetical protein
MNLNDLFNEEKVRLDPKCWTGKKIGNPKTKVKGGVRVNNCVPAESVEEGGVGSGRPDPTAWDTSSGKVGRVEKTATGLRHHADPSRYGGTIPEPEHDKLLNPQQRWRMDKITQPIDGMDEGEQQKGADYRDPREVDYDDEYDAMVARVKKLAGLGPMKTVYDPNRRQYRNMPTADQPKR